MAKIGRHTAPISPFDHWSSDRLRLLRAVEGKRYPNPTLFGSREASEPYSRGQWDSALKATPHSPEGDVSYVGASERTARSDAHGFRSRRPRLLLTVLNYCRIGVKEFIG